LCQLENYPKKQEMMPRSHIKKGNDRKLSAHQLKINFLLFTAVTFRGRNVETQLFDKTQELKCHINVTDQPTMTIKEH
jgi:hypothetical protein